MRGVRHGQIPHGHLPRPGPLSPPPFTAVGTRWPRFLQPLSPGARRVRSDHVVTFVCHPTKAARLVPARIEPAAGYHLDTPEVARLFFDNIFLHHGLPQVLVSYRDSRFTGRFWRELGRLTGTKLAKSTAWHPQSNRLTERQHRVIGDALRAFLLTRPSDWRDGITTLEFAMNNGISASACMDPFYADKGFYPLVPAILDLPSLSDAVADVALRLCNHI